MASPTTELLRHLLATLAYRATKVLRDPPAEFGAYAMGPTTRRPVEIVGHMADLMEWGLHLARGEQKWVAAASDDWSMEIDRFYVGVAALDRQLVEADPDVVSTDRLIQGPLSDALTHVGQLAMMRGHVGSPVRPESYARAEIVRGRVGPDQARANREFDGDASARK